MKRVRGRLEAPARACSRSAVAANPVPRSSPNTRGWPPDDIAAAQLVITGEGRFDHQSLHGKVVSALAAGARSHHIPVLVLAGQVTLDESARREAGIAAALSITDRAGSVQRAIEDAANQLEGLAEVTAAAWG
jgi:glycerate 2-kinase